jgi:hypothetical protein
MTTKRRIFRKYSKPRLHSVTNPSQLTHADIDEAMDILEDCGLIERTTMPDGEVRIRLPYAPAPACYQYLIWEGDQ